MSNKCISTTNAPAAIGPYSQAVQAGNTVYISGQLPVDPSGTLIQEIKAATKCSLENLAAIAEAAGYTLADAVKVTVYLASMTDFVAMNEVYATYFASNPPARCCIQAGALPKGAIVEIDAILAK